MEPTLLSPPLPQTQGEASIQDAVYPVKSRSTELRTLQGGSESPASGGRTVHSGQALCSGAEESHPPPGPQRPGVSFTWPTAPHMGIKKREFQQGTPAQPSL